MDHSQEVLAIATTAEERIQIELLPPDCLSLETTRLWVRKEACLKAIGIGLLIELATFPAWNIKQQWTTVIFGSYVLAVNDFCCGEDTVVSIATTQSTPIFVRHYSLDWSAIAKDIGEIE
ncbi:MAG: 4'-phosphopantetheinyl transferase superfamily protein [Nostoc sp. DedQUE05]|nr:4'-phosphopantetheinyl transferase superfamily protein [Nostoc sp. DedQUE05]MDZ8091519.1 4'-phosphopantetheinyl transferase superfamily protein [Nostoc sp. DedQUE05]